MSYDIQHKLVDKQDIRFRTKWYKNAIKNKAFDWDESYMKVDGYPQRSGPASG